MENDTYESSIGKFNHVPVCKNLIYFSINKSSDKIVWKCAHKYQSTQTFNYRGDWMQIFVMN